MREEVRKISSTVRCFVELISEGKGGWIVVLSVQQDDGGTVVINEVLRGRGYVYDKQESRQ